MAADCNDRVDLSDLLKDGAVVANRSAREENQSPAAERRLNDVRHTILLVKEVPRCIGGLRLRLCDVLCRWFHLNDVGPEQRGQVRAIRDDIKSRLCRGIELAATWVSPNHNGKASRPRFRGAGANLFEHLVLAVRAGVDRIPDRRATKLERLAHRSRNGLVFDGAEAVGVVRLEDERHFSRETVRTRRQQPVRRGEGAQTCLDRQLEVITWVIPGRVLRKAAGGAVLETLVDREDHELTRAPGAAEY